MGSLWMRSLISLRSGGDALPWGLVAPVVMIRSFVFEAMAVTISDVLRGVLRGVRRCEAKCQDVPHYIGFCGVSLPTGRPPNPANR